MHATIKAIPCGMGDCIFLILQDGEEKFSIMVDCGSYKDEVRNEVEKELSNNINLLIVTHYDDDHVKGVIKMLNGNNAPIVNKIIYNCLQPGQQEGLKTLSEKQREILDIKEIALKIPIGLDKEPHGVSARQGAILAELLHRKYRNAWNDSMYTTGMEISLGGKWGKLIILSPSMNAVEKLRKDFYRYIKKNGVMDVNEAFSNQEKYFELLMRLASRQNSVPNKVVGIGAQMIKMEKEAWEHYAKREYDETVTASNDASLAMIWECGNHKILFGGDAPASEILVGLKQIGIIDTEYFDAVKVPHHGSKNNNSEELYSRVKSRHYFVLGGAKSQGPHIETIARISLSHNESKTIHYTKGDNFLTMGLLSKTSQDFLQQINTLFDKNCQYGFEF